MLVLSQIALWLKSFLIGFFFLISDDNLADQNFFINLFLSSILNVLRLVKMNLQTNKQECGHT